MVGGGPTIDKLQFSYDGRPVAKLSKLAFVLVNTGRTAIRASDIVAAPAIILFGTSILDVRIDSVSPANLIVVPKLDPPNHSVSLEFPLLNPGDQIQFSVLVESEDPKVEATARIAGLTTLAYLDQRAEMDTVRRSVPWTVWVVGVFTAFCLFATCVGLHGVGEESAIKRFASSDLVRVPVGLKPNEYIAIFAGALPDYKKNEMKKINEYLETLPPTVALDEQRVGTLRSLFREAVPSSSMVGMAVFFLLLSAIGLVYIFKAMS
jgi:hypothetical protein